MYSLYRAWFGSEDSYPRVESLSPPDTVVRVGSEGEYHFVAHRAVLAAHSGYLKALLTSAPGTTTDSSVGTSSSNNGNQPLIASVVVPSTIGGEAFAPLLNYMYTGRLEVSLDNIYTVLLATHLLHMPGALEQCRAALLRLRAPSIVPASVSPTSQPPPQSLSSSLPLQQQQMNSVLRPVPNRLLGPTFGWSQSTATASHLYSTRHLEFSHLPTFQLSSTISVQPTSSMQKTVLPYRFESKEPSISPSSNSSQLQQHSTDRRSASASPELVVASSSTSSITQRSDEQKSLLQCSSPSTSNERASERDQDNKQQQQKEQEEQWICHSRPSHKQIQSARLGRGNQREKSSSSSTISSVAIQTPGVIYDVACCDGPVRFHRVLNENYSPAADQASVSDNQQHRDNHHDQKKQQSTQRHVEYRLLSSGHCNGRNSTCHQTEEPSAGCRENDENDHHSVQNEASHGIGNNISDNRLGNFTCAYCQHTFKSQYCYRKHTRRHLLPTDAENAVNLQLLQQSQRQSRLQQEPRVQQQEAEGSQLETRKREVRLLDLNVQYYPCKICGSKFPSYYFVHKHRKLCHANVEEPQSRFSSTEDQMSVKSAVLSLVPTQQHQPSTSENIQQPT